MKAAVCREHGKPLVIETLKLDPPQAGEVKVQIAACAICHSDIILWTVDGVVKSLLCMDTRLRG